MAGGRPSKYKKEYPKLLIAHMSKGLSFDCFAADCGVHIDTMHEWAKVHKEFSEAKRLGLALSLKVWEQIGIAGTTGKMKGFNTAAWIFNMKNRFRWRDSFDFHHSESGEAKKIEVSYKVD
jgi:hypothetical protein